MASSAPLYPWSVAHDIIRKRQLGTGTRFGANQFAHSFTHITSLTAVERLNLLKTLNAHTSSVNCISFNADGNKLASGGGDGIIFVWDWASGNTLVTFDQANNQILQAKFLAFNDQRLVMSTLSGKVGLVDVSAPNTPARILANHTGAVYSLATNVNSSNMVLSCGTDGVVFESDLRTGKTNKILTLDHATKKLPLWSICSNPMDSFLFSVCGDACHVFIYDRRHIAAGNTNILNHYCPGHLENSAYSIGSAVYSQTGDELLMSYNNENIYMFPTRNSLSNEYSFHYQGHPPQNYPHGVNFFGPNNEFIVCGSRCANMFLWEKKTGKIVQTMHADDLDIVHEFAPHPFAAVMATAGLDNAVKIWTPL